MLSFGYSTSVAIFFILASNSANAEQHGLDRASHLPVNCIDVEVYTGHIFKNP